MILFYLRFYDIMYITLNVYRKKVCECIGNVEYFILLDPRSIEINPNLYTSYTVYREHVVKYIVIWLSSQIQASCHD